MAGFVSATAAQCLAYRVSRPSYSANEITSWMESTAAVSGGDIPCQYSSLTVW